MAIHIAVGADDNYIEGLMVLIASTNFYNPQARFTVLDQSISAENKNRLKEMADMLNCRIDILTVPQSDFSNIAMNNKHISLASFFRLKLPEYLPEDDKVLYLDSDMVVLGPLDGLWNADIDQALVAAVTDAPITGTEWTAEHRAVGVPPGEYVQAGVLLINLSAWRDEGISAACLSYLADSTQERYFDDQSAVNFVCKGRIATLDQVWHLLLGRRRHVPTDQLEGNMPRIIHYSGGDKPWQGKDVLLGEVWALHARRIRPLFPKKPPGRRMRDWLLIVERRRRDKFRRILGRPSRSTHTRIAQDVRKMIIDTVKQDISNS